MSSKKRHGPPGHRSAFEWVIDQYRVKEDKRSGIRSDDPEYIARLVGPVRVNVEAVKIAAGLPKNYGDTG